MPKIRFKKKIAVETLPVSIHEFGEMNLVYTFRDVELFPRIWSCVKENEKHR